MSVNYLVDFENVHETGLSGMRSLTAEDCVYVFHTSMNDRISLRCLDDVRAWVKVIPVPPGKQSLDMHLGSFLGYLIGKEENPETRYAVVSRDTDYSGIIDFWNSAYGSYDKVRCIPRIGGGTGTAVMNPAPVLPDTKAERAAIHDFIIRAFSKHGVAGLDGRTCMLVSELCTMLNSLPEYRNARRRLDRKPMQYLEEECRDILQVRRQWQQDWAYLTEGRQILTETENMKEDLQQIPQAEAEEMIPDEKLPDIMEIGDLSIDGELPDAGEPEETAMAEEDEPLTVAGPVSAQPASRAPEEEKPENTDFLAFAMDCIREMEGEEKDAGGYLRASALRDRLLSIPGFRRALKESGMKPIPFMQYLFAGKIRIWRENGVFRAAPDDPRINSAEEGNVDELAERRRTFYERAFSNIQQQLSGAGLAKETADEIADIFMHSNSAAEPRKVIHTLLCQRFGNKIGARYYRQAVKYVSV